MAVVVDASVALKWVVTEPETPAAEALRANEDLYAPELIYLECGNALWRMARRGAITPDQAKAGLAAIQLVPISITPSSALAARAQALALALDHPIYDCVYLALALSMALPLVSADQRFLGRLSQTPYARAAHPLV